MVKEIESLSIRSSIVPRERERERERERVGGGIK